MAMAITVDPFAKTAVMLDPPVICRVEETGPERIRVVGAEQAKICGVFKSVGCSARSIYINKPVADVRRSQPAPRSLHAQVCSRQSASRWVELIARLYIASHTE